MTKITGASAVASGLKGESVGEPLEGKAVASTRKSSGAGANAEGDAGAETGVDTEADAIAVRRATPDDALALLAIYAPYVLKTAITYEYEVPSEDEFRRRIEHTLKAGYPYLVLERGGVPVGYAYVGRLHERVAYDWAVETSIYLAEGERGRGSGRTLHDALEAALRVMGILDMCACIATPNGADDEYLTHNSEQFHAHLGYRKVGEFVQCALKFGRWYNMVWMEKSLGERTSNAPAPKRFDEVADLLGYR